MNDKQGTDEPAFRLQACRTTTRMWRDLHEAYASPTEARSAAAAERGIYRMVYVREGRRLPVDLFAVVGAE